MNTWCVPFAFAYVSGKTPDDIADLLKSDRGSSRAVKRVYAFEYPALLRHLGIKIGAIVDKPGMTLRKWVAVRARHNDTGLWLVRVTGHMLVLDAGKLYDNCNHGGVALDGYAYANSRMRSAWQVIK